MDKVKENSVIVSIVQMSLHNFGNYSVGYVNAHQVLNPHVGVVLSLGSADVCPVLIVHCFYTAAFGTSVVAKPPYIREQNAFGIQMFHFL
jgi:hypothetical protein